MAATEVGVMRAFRFHLVGNPVPVDLEVAADSISTLCEIISRQRFIEGRLMQPDGDGVLLGALIATSRIQCVIESS